MISQTGRYALRILGHLAERPGAWVQGREIAVATGIPGMYLVKILNQLRKGGFVRSQKGWGGGFVLREAALGAPIADVLDCIEGPFEESGCLFELRDCDASHPCPLHDSWERVRNEFRGMIGSVTVGDLRDPARRPPAGKTRVPSRSRPRAAEKETATTERASHRPRKAAR